MLTVLERCDTPLPVGREELELRDERRSCELCGEGPAECRARPRPSRPGPPSEDSEASSSGDRASPPLSVYACEVLERRLGIGLELARELGASVAEAAELAKDLIRRDVVYEDPGGGLWPAGYVCGECKRIFYEPGPLEAEPSPGNWRVELD